MLLYVTDAMEESERVELRAHLASGCPKCAGALAEAQATVAHLPLSLDPQPAPKSARDTLLNRVAADKAATPPLASSRKSFSSGWFLRTAIAACIGAIITFAALYMPMHRKLMPIEADQLQFVKLAGDATQQPTGHGRVFWDKDHNQWHVYVFDMKPPPPGRQYELWFIMPDQKKVKAGMFNVDEKGRGSLLVDVPADMNNVAVAAVTDEPMGGVDQPTGKVQLVGQMQ